MILDIGHNFVEVAAATCVAGVLIASSFTDLRLRRIPNALPLTLFVVWVGVTAARIASGQPVYDAALLPAATGFAVLCVTALLFARGALGGGDVKLLSALAFYAGADAILSVLILMGLVGGVLTLLIVIGTRAGLLTDSRVPYGIAIGIAGLPLCAGPWMSLTA